MSELPEEMMYNSVRILALETLVMTMEETIRNLKNNGHAKQTVELLEALLGGLDEA